MQSPALLLLLLGATAAAAALKCQTTKRTATDLEAMAAAPLIHYSDRDSGECTGGGWQACAHLITKVGGQWDEWRSGCWSSARGDDAFRPVATLIHKYCADTGRHQCVQTLRMDWEDHWHYPLYICCCYSDDCDAEVASFARQQLLNAPKDVEWDSGLENTCLWRESQAWTLDVLDRGPWDHIGDAKDEDCRHLSVMGPCADFVYQSKTADGRPDQWHHWLAGCTADKHTSDRYGHLIEQYCSAATVNQCFTFDMTEPASRQAKAPYYTTAYLCCCQTHTLVNGLPRTCRDTVAFAQAEIAKRQPLTSAPTTMASTSAAAITTAPMTATSPTSKRGSLSSAAASTAADDDSSLPVVLIIVALVVVVGLIIAAAVLLVLVCVKEKTLKVGADTTTLDTTTAGSTLATTATVD